MIAVLVRSGLSLISRTLLTKLGSVLYSRDVGVQGLKTADIWVFKPVLQTPKAVYRNADCSVSDYRLALTTPDVSPYKRIYP